MLQYQLGTAIRVETTAVAATYLSNRLMIGLLSGIPAGAAVRLQQRLPGEEWTNYGEYYAATGIVRVKYPVAQTASWRLLYEGDAAHRAATGPTVAVKVAPQLLLSGAGGYVRQRLSGAVVRIVGAVSPVSAAVTLVRYRCNALFASCVVSARISVAPDTTGAVSYEWKATRGYWIWKLQSAAGLGLEYATTAKLRFSVR